MLLPRSPISQLGRWRPPPPGACPALPLLPPSPAPLRLRGPERCPHSTWRPPASALPHSARACPHSAWRPRGSGSGRGAAAGRRPGRATTRRGPTTARRSACGGPSSHWAEYGQGMGSTWAGHGHGHGQHMGWGALALTPVPLSRRPSGSKAGQVWAPEGSTAFKCLISARFCAALLSNVSDCDETFNYWEPVSAAPRPRPRPHAERGRCPVTLLLCLSLPCRCTTSSTGKGSRPGSTRPPTPSAPTPTFGFTPCQRCSTPESCRPIR